MHLTAHLSAGDFARVLAQLTPLRVSLDATKNSRFLALRPPEKVELTARGLRIVTDLQLQWDVIGLRVPVSMNGVSVLLTPSVIEQDGELVLLLGVKIEDADVSAIPGFLEGVLIDRVNDALARPEAAIVWPFMDTLDFMFQLPPQVRPRHRVRLFAPSGSVQLTQDALVLRVDWGLEVHPHDHPAPAPAGRDSL
jgi:hypothetical protein